MKRYTIQEAAKELGISRNTLTRRLCTMNVTPQTQSFDRRKRYLTEKEIEKIRTKYAHVKYDKDQSIISADSVQKRKLSYAELEAKVKELEDKLARYSQPQYASNMHYESSKQSPSRKKSTREPLPAYLQSLEGFCKQHGISVTTVRKAISVRRLPMPLVGEWVQGRAPVKLAIDEDMQAAILRLYGNRDHVQEFVEMN